MEKAALWQKELRNKVQTTIFSAEDPLKLIK
jgi:hypothetical protein